MLKKILKNHPLFLPENEWEMTFEDNFEFLDLSKWKINTVINKSEPKKSGIRNCAFNVSDPDVVFTENGKLHIRTKWKESEHGCGWHTAFLETSVNVNKEYETPGYRGFSQAGGYFEVRCKVARALGIWSAFWLMPDNDIAFSENDIQWSGEDGVEIDIMESPHCFHLTERGKNQNIHVIHADGYDERLKSHRSPAFHVPKMYDEFHTYGLLWEDDRYEFYIDGFKTWETRHVHEGREMGICRAEEYLLLSSEVAGFMENGVQYPGKVKNKQTGRLENFWCGNPDKNDKTKNYDFIVDYVRCYKRK